MLENIMEQRKREKHIFNGLLAKLVGLHQILNPESDKLYGYNVYHITFVILILYLILVSSITFINGLFNWTNNRTEAILHFGIAECGMFSSYKMSILIRRSKEIRNCLSITRFDFTSYGRTRDVRLLKLWRSRIILITSSYAVIFFLMIILFTSSPLIFRHGVSTVKSLDGSQSYYRINVINLYAMLPAETYNTHFNTIYLIEALCIYVFTLFFIVFDTLIITFCLAYSCQLRVISEAFESSGRKRISKVLNQSMFL